VFSKKTELLKDFTKTKIKQTKNCKNQKQNKQAKDLHCGPGVSSLNPSARRSLADGFMAEVPGLHGRFFV